MKNIFKLCFTFLILLAPIVFATGPSVSIQSLYPGSSVLPGNAVYFSVITSGFYGGVTYSVSDSISSSVASSATINNNGNFVWIPTASDRGAHVITVTASDGTPGGSASASVQININVPTVTIGSLSPGASVTAGSGVFFSVSATGFNNPKYSVSDSIMTSTLQSTNINSSGGFSWVPKAYDVGTHTITVNVVDNDGGSASASQSIIVNAPASTSIQSLLPANATVSFGQPVSFKVVATGFTSPTYSLLDSFYGGTITNVNLDSSGTFNWKPMTQDLGAHNLSISVTDATNSIVLSQTLYVLNASMFLQVATSSSINTKVGNTFSMTASSTGLINPSYTVVDYFPRSTASSANINSSGVFIWTPALTDIGTHNMTVTGRDAYNHTASASLVVTVEGQGVTGSGTREMVQSTGNVGTVASGGRTHRFLKALSFGSKGNDVSELQKRLILEGVYTGPVTGYYGTLTVASVKKYQELHGIQKLGNVGPATRTSLNN